MQSNTCYNFHVLIIQIGTVQAFDMRPYLDLLHHLLTMEDSWQVNRLRVCFVGKYNSYHTKTIKILFIDGIKNLIYCLKFSVWMHDTLYFFSLFILQ